MNECELAVCCPGRQQTGYQFPAGPMQDTCINSKKIRGSIDMRMKWVEELRDLKIVKTIHISGEDNLADILTKCLKGPKHSSMVEKTVDFQKSEILGGHMYLSICQ